MHNMYISTGTETKQGHTEVYLTDEAVLTALVGVLVTHYAHVPGDDFFILNQREPMGDAEFPVGLVVTAPVLRDLQVGVCTPAGDVRVNVKVNVTTIIGPTPLK